MFVGGRAEDGYALSIPRCNTNLRDGHPDQLTGVGDQQDLVAVIDREGAHQLAAALGQILGGQALAAATGAAIVVGAGALAEAFRRHRQQDLLGRAQFGDAFRGQAGLADVFVALFPNGFWHGRSLLAFLAQGSGQGPLVLEVGGAFGRGGVDIAQHAHRDDAVASAQAHAAHAGRIAAGEHPHFVGREADAAAGGGVEQDVLAAVADGDPDDAVAFVQLHGDLAVAAHVHEVRQLVATHAARAGGEHHVQAVPGGLVLG